MSWDESVGHILLAFEGHTSPDGNSQIDPSVGERYRPHVKSSRSTVLSEVLGHAAKGKAASLDTQPQRGYVGMRTCILCITGDAEAVG